MEQCPTTYVYEYLDCFAKCYLFEILMHLNPCGAETEFVRDN